MTARTRAAVCLMMSALVMRLALTGEHRKYVRNALGPWLLLAGALLAIATIVAWRTEPDAEDEHDHHQHDLHQHDHASSRVGLALVAVAVVLFVVAPGALGSYGLRSGNAAQPGSRSSSYSPLVATSETPILMKDFVGRAFERDGFSMVGATVRLTGFIDDSTTYEVRLARYQIACCAADAEAAIVRLDGFERPAGKSIWVEATGTYAGTTKAIPTLAVSSFTIISEPEEPYE
jgi:uncharacterized repeat protein (TIGR03943 family)